MKRSRGNAVGIAREMKKTQDGILGTLAWIQPKVKPDVYEKMLAQGWWKNDIS